MKSHIWESPCESATSCSARSLEKLSCKNKWVLRGRRGCVGWGGLLLGQAGGVVGGQLEAASCQVGKGGK